MVVEMGRRQFSASFQGKHWCSFLLSACLDVCWITLGLRLTVVFGLSVEDRPGRQQHQAESNELISHSGCPACVVWCMCVGSV
jgi:hypothetical protein